MFEIGNDWKFKFHRESKARLNNLGRIEQPIAPIEPDIVFTKNIICFHATAKEYDVRWVAVGSLMQAYLVPIGSAGYAQGDEKFIRLHRYHIFQFNNLPWYPSESRYVLSFAPKRWMIDIAITAWEYHGRDGVSNEELLNNIQAVHQTARKTLTVARQAQNILKDRK